MRSTDNLTDGSCEGTLFATSVALGGRLHSTRVLNAEEKNNLTETKEELRVAVGASISSSWVSASASYAQKDVSEGSKGTGSLRKSLTLTWDARGGDTLLYSK